MNKKILGIMDENPFDPKTWSGSSLYFFNALKANKSLFEAISAEPPKSAELLFKTLSMSFDLKKWKFKYHLNTGLFRQMTLAAERQIRTFDNDDFDIILQVGAWYNFTSFNNKILASYHDGNLATRLKSPYGYPAVRDKYLNRAYQYERNLYEKLDFIFPMSKWLARSFVEDFRVDENKVIPVGAGINLPRIHQPVEKDPDKLSILFIGKDFKRKGGHVLIDAFTYVRKNMRNVELVIAGPNDIGNLPDGVRCEGYISKETDAGIEKLLTLYSQANIFVLPSLYEPFGIAFAEAMAHKLPCIGTDNCAMPEIIDSGINGFIVKPNNSRELAEKIILLLQDSSLRESMGAAAYDKYFTNYRWNIVAEKICNTLNQNRAGH